VFDSFIDGYEVNICYDPTQCYLWEMESYSDECEFTITQGGVEKKTGKLTYDAFQVGECGARCQPGQEEVHFLSYIEGYGDIGYTMHRSGLGDEKGVIIEGDSTSYCIESTNCNIMARDKSGWTYFLYFAEDGSLIDSGGFEFTKLFGDCDAGCGADATLLISTAKDGNLTLAIGTDDEPGAKEVLSGGQAKSVCIDESKCSVIDGQGDAIYYFLRDNEVFDQGLPSEYLYFGPCKTLCTERPFLADTERGLQIVSRLASVSGMAELVDFNSDRYKSACWIIYDDLQRYDADDPKLVQRYILAVIYHTTGGENWFSQVGFMGGKDECAWQAITCTDNSVTGINLSGNNLIGTIAPELYSLINLKNLVADFNKLTGTIPYGISRLSLRAINFALNNLSGPIPEDFFLMDGLEDVSMEQNLFTGTIPELHGDVTKIIQLWIQRNLLTSTIPQWIGELSSVQGLYMHLNLFTGTLPKNLNLDSAREFHIYFNSFTGTIPPEVFALPSLIDVQFSGNHFSGELKMPKNLTRTALKNVWLNDNDLTGTIPKDILKLRKLKILYLHKNRFSGSIPKAIMGLNRLKFLRVEENDLVGSMTFKNCEDFVILSADCASPRNVNCPCCTRCFGLFTTHNDILPCQSSILKAKSIGVGARLEYYAENIDSQLVTEKVTYGEEFVESCISPTDCMTVTSTARVGAFFTEVDGNLVIEELEGAGAKASFGYSSDGIMKPDTCDEFKICGRSLVPGTMHRKLFNLVTRFSGVEIFDKRGYEYQAMCWWLTDLDTSTQSERSAQESTLYVQRYLLAVIYNSMGGDNWINNQNWMTSAPECEWFGVSCDTFDKVISSIDLINNNLVGSIPKEVGEMRGLENLVFSGNSIIGSMPLEIVQLNNLRKLDLSNNVVQGNIPPEIHFLGNLEDLDLNTNRITSTLPSELSMIKTLRSLNVGNNAFSGGIPPEYRDLQNLRTISVKGNLLGGGLDMFSDLVDLEHIDFSDNYFEGSLPIYGSKQANLRVANLNNNQFSFAIPEGIEELVNLEELMVHGNSLTGSLPSQMGLLHNITKISFAYNSLKGTIPTEFANMRRLELMHLHANQLEGNADHFNYSVASFITDCGLTEISNGLTTCKECTECCNVDGGCITVAETWPKNHIKAMGLQPAILVMGFSLGFSFVLMCLCAILSIFSKHLPRLPYIVRQEFQQDSAYRWFLSTNYSAWFWAFVALVFQLWLVLVFLQSGDYTFKGNLWLYSKDCPDNDTLCYQTKTTDLAGWITFVAILAVFLLQDLIPGLLIFYESSVDFCWKGLFAGLAILNITILSAVASAIFIYATSLSNIVIYMNAVIVLFLNSIDEQVFMIVQRVAPGWADDVEVEIMNSTLDKLTAEVSEVEEDYDADSEYAPDMPKGGEENCHDCTSTVDSGHTIKPNGGDFEMIKQLIAEMTEASNTCILEELKQVKEENEADKASILEELKQVKEENAALKEALNSGKGQVMR